MEEEEVVNEFLKAEEETDENFLGYRYSLGRDGLPHFWDMCIHLNEKTLDCELPGHLVSNICLGLCKKTCSDCIRKNDVMYI